MNVIKNWFNDAINYLNDLLEPFRDFIAENTRNPFLWIGFIVLGLIVFELVFRALHKD